VKSLSSPPDSGGVGRISESQAKKERRRPAPPLAQPPQPIGILVAGMHRSGTSALARTINLLGAALPSEVLGPSANNPLGHWEPRATYALQNEFLEAIQTRWDEWTAFADGVFESPVAAVYAHRLSAFLTEEFEQKALFVAKDPRVCRLIPLWRQAADISRMDLRVVIPIRHPTEVAASLNARNGMAPTHAVLLWLRYVLAAEADSRDMVRSFVSYDQLLNDWRSTMRRVGSDLSIVWPRWDMKAEHEISGFLQPDHRHHAVGDARVDGSVAAWAQAAYNALSRLAEGSDPREPQADLDAIAVAFDEACRIFWPVIFEEIAITQERADKQRHEVKRERNEALSKMAVLEEQAAQVPVLNDKLAQARAAAAAAPALQEELDRTRALAEQARELTEQRSALKQTVAGLKASLSEASATAAQVPVLAAQIGVQQAASVAERERFQALLAEKSREVEELSVTTRQHNARVAELEERGARLTEELQTSQRELEAKRNALAEAEQAVAKHVENTRALQKDVEDASIVMLDLRKTAKAAARNAAEAAANAERQAGLVVERRRLRDSETRTRLVAHEATTRIQRLEVDQTALLDRSAQLHDQIAALSARPALRTSLTALRGLNQLLSRLTRPKDPVRALGRLVTTSGLFDVAWYVEQRPDSRFALVSPVEHFLRHGAAAGASPHPLFDPRWYVHANALTIDLKDALPHYLRTGGREGLSPHPLFDARWYLEQNPDVAAAGENALLHYLTAGTREGRTPHPFFDGAEYMARNADVDASGLDPLVHYASRGLAEGRIVNERLSGDLIERLRLTPLFDTAWYLRNRPRVVATAIDPIVHYLLWGCRDGGSPHPLFDPQWYLTKNPKAEGGTYEPLSNFLARGGRKGWSPHQVFDAAWYLKTNPDIAKVGVNPLEHFVRHGLGEGRSPHPQIDLEAYFAEASAAEIDRSPAEHFLLWATARLNASKPRA
jgi:hypothetical protein